MEYRKYPDNFLGIEDEYSNFKDSKVLILPVPYEGTVSYVKGAAKAPEAIIKASQQVELYDEELEKEHFDGICTLNPLKVSESPEDVVKKVYGTVKELIDSGKTVCTLGGEHSISLGPIKAYKEKYPGLSVLQIDAHADLREEYEGTRFSHACVMKRVFDEKIPFVSVGIRNLSIEEAKLVKDNKLNVFFAHKIHGLEDDYWMDDVIEKLSKNVYLTFDLDGLDSSIMPATGTPEPGGLEWYQVLKLLRKLAGAKNIVGFDVVELAPIQGLHHADFTAAKLIYKIIGYMRK